MRTEVHTFAFSVAANALLSFFPFVVLLMTLIRRLFRSAGMYEVVVQLLRDYLPAGQDFVIRNLNAMVGARHQAQIVSLVILLVTSTGIFIPLEVALNRIWGFQENRSYLGNQLISLGLAFWCGVLALVSIGLAIPVVVTFLEEGIVPRLPTAVLSMGLIILAMLSVSSGLVLDTVTRGRREMKLLAYLSQGPVGKS